MADGKYISINANGLKEEEQAVNSTTGVSDASKIIRTDATGYLDPSFLPAPEEKNVVASEDLAAGDWVTLWNDSGTIKMRKADCSIASGAGVAHGFVLTSVLEDAIGTIYFEGINSQVAGLTPGARYYLSTVGAETSTTITTSGYINQYLGTAISATEINCEIAEPVIRV